jgi:hypothetical protein
MTANISRLLQPVDQEKLPAPMSHFDSPAEAPAPRGKKTKAKWPGDGKTAHRPTPTPPNPVLKKQKRDTSRVRNFFAFALPLR